MGKEVLFYVKDLSKSYASKEVLDKVTYNVCKGEVLGILGSNGAGKSTMFRIISGLAKKTSGEVGFVENDTTFGSKKYKCNLGIVPQDISLYGNMSVRENLKLFCRLYGLRGAKVNQRVEDIVKELCLTDKMNTEVDKLSGGMKRRVNIGAAIVHNPSLVIMDEPTVGIDPENRKAVWDIIQKLRNKGVSVIITSHYIEEIEQLSDNVIVVNKGRKVAEGSPQQLVDEYGRFVIYSIEFFELNNNTRKNLIQEVKKSINSQNILVDEAKISITTDKENVGCIEKVIEIAKKLSLEIKNINVKKSNLEDVFISLINKEEL